MESFINKFMEGAKWSVQAIRVAIIGTILFIAIIDNDF